jgi:tetratricopeptide (TPR) repeat protein
MELSNLESMSFWDEPNAALCVGVAARDAGHYDIAGEMFRRALELSREWGYESIEGMAAGFLTTVYGRMGKLEAAQEVVDEALPSVRRQLGPSSTTTRFFLQAAITARCLAQYDDCIRLLNESRLAAERSGETHIHIGASLQEALIARDRGLLDEAKRSLDDLTRLIKEASGEYAADFYMTVVRVEQAGIHLRVREPESALQRIGDVFARRAALVHSQEVEIVDLTSIALLQMGRTDVAARLMGAADAEREQTGLVVEPPDRPLLDEARQQVRSQLGDTWEAEYEKGRAKSLDETLELAGGIVSQHTESSQVFSPLPDE